MVELRISMEDVGALLLLIISDDVLDEAVDGAGVADGDGLPTPVTT